MQRVLAGVPFRLSMQTNGLLLDDEWLDLLVELDVWFAISLDGPPDVNDRHRLTKRGAPTGRRVVQAVEMVQGHPARELFGGVLSVIDPDARGDAVLQFFLDLGLHRIDF